MRRTGAQIIWETLVREGAKTIFGYPGGAILPAYDAILDYPIRHILVRHEQAAAHMADGFARATGDVGFALATSGPGATNLVTGIATAMLDSSPIVCITGQVPTPLIGKDAFQEIDITGITLPITKHNYLVTRASDIARCIREAIYVANSGRKGPVLVDITKDAQQEEIDFVADDRPISLAGYRPDLRAHPDEISRAIELIDASLRPVILAGHGILESGAMRALLDFVERTSIPVATTLLGLGAFPASHGQGLGMMGMHGEAWVNKAIQEADLLIALGMRFDDRVTGKIATYAPHSKKIHVDIDPAEIDKNVKVDVGIIGDVREILETFSSRVREKTRSEWQSHISTIRDDSATRDIQRIEDDGELYAAHVIHDLWTLTDDRTVVVTDVGQHQMWEAQYFRHERPRTLITSGGLGTMGFGLPAAIGARVARPDADVWLIAGDGGFQMTAAELSTCAQEGLKINIAIINNGFLGMVRQWQEFFYGRRYSATPIRSPDFVKLAEAHGLVGFRVEKRSEIEEVVRRAKLEPGTVLIDFKVKQEDSVYPMVPSGANLDEMIRRPVHGIYETGED